MHKYAAAPFIAAMLTGFTQRAQAQDMVGRRSGDPTTPHTYKHSH